MGLACEHADLILRSERSERLEGWPKARSSLVAILRDARPRPAGDGELLRIRSRVLDSRLRGNELGH